MSFLRSLACSDSVGILLRYAPPGFVFDLASGGQINPDEFRANNCPKLDDAGLSVPDNIPTFDLESIVISRPPTPILGVALSAEVGNSPTYELIKRIPSSDLPLPVGRINGSPPVTRFNQQSVVTLAQSITQRNFGCLLHEPIRQDPITIQQCSSEELAQDEQDNIILNFAAWLSRGLLLSEVENILDRACDLSVVALTVFTGPGVGKIATLIGCKTLKYYLLDQVASNLTATSIGVQSTIPTGVEVIDCEPLPVDDTGNQFELCDDSLNSCFVPIRNLRSNLPGSEGYKKQLQIVFSDSPNSLNDVRQISIPSPLDPDSISKSRILSALGLSAGSSLRFGKVKYEIDVSPYGYLRYYGPEEAAPFSNARSLFQRISDQLINGTIIESSFRASNRDRSFDEVDLFPAKALLFDFSQPNAICTRWDLRP